MIVAQKDPLNLQLPQHGEGSLTARNRSRETKLIGRTAGKVGSSPALGDHRLYFQTLREMLESDNYQVALVPRGRGNLWSPRIHRRRQLSSYLSGGRNWLPTFVSSSATLSPCSSAGLPGSGMSALILPGWK